MARAKQEMEARARQVEDARAEALFSDFLQRAGALGSPTSFRFADNADVRAAVVTADAANGGPGLDRRLKRARRSVASPESLEQIADPTRSSSGFAAGDPTNLGDPFTARPIAGNP